MILESPSEIPVSDGSLNLSAGDTTPEFVSCLDGDKMPEHFYPTQFKVCGLALAGYMS